MLGHTDVFFIIGKKEIYAHAYTQCNYSQLSWGKLYNQTQLRKQFLLHVAFDVIGICIERLIVLTECLQNGSLLFEF